MLAVGFAGVDMVGSPSAPNTLRLVIAEPRWINVRLYFIQKQWHEGEGYYKE